MKKQIKWIEVDYDFTNWRFGSTIEIMKKELDQLEKLGVTDIEIEAVQEWDVPLLSIKAFVPRQETNEEFNDRINEEKQKENKIRMQELEQLRKLKIKYENEKI